jgi:hypothetical protein
MKIILLQSTINLQADYTYSADSWTRVLAAKLFILISLKHHFFPQYNSSTFLPFIPVFIFSPLSVKKQVLQWRHTQFPPNFVPLNFSSEDKTPKMFQLSWVLHTLFKSSWSTPTEVFTDNCCDFN